MASRDRGRFQVIPGGAEVAGQITVSIPISASATETFSSAFPGTKELQFAMGERPSDEFRERWLDERFAKIDQKIEYQGKLIEQKISEQSAKLDQFLSEMRERDNQRHAEILATRQELQSSVNTVLASNKQITWAIGLGFLAIAAAVLIAHFFPVR